MPGFAGAAEYSHGAALVAVSLTVASLNARDVRALPFMPLFVGRLLTSDTWLLASGDEAKAAVTLWARSWHQVPAGTLPNDERLLAALSGAGARWRKVREVALRGFLLGDDGRLHHELIEGAADDALARFEGQQTRTAAATAARMAKRTADRVQRDVQRDDQRDELRNVYQRERNVTDNVNGPSVASLPPEPKWELRAPPLPPAASVVANAPRPPSAAAGRTVATWNAYAAAYRLRYGVEPLRNRTVNGHLAALVARVDEGEAPDVAAHYVRSSRGLYVAAKHATNLLVRDAEALRTEWATGTHGTETQARQADRQQATGNVFGRLIEEARNGTSG